MEEIVKYLGKKLVPNVLAAALILFFTAVSSASAGGNEDGEKDFNICKKFVHERLWDQAVSCCSTFVNKHPKSLFTDDAMFWQGFSLEQLKGRDTEALRIFQELTSKFPESTWADDASVHQIILAKRLCKKGSRQYLSTIYPFLSSRDSTIQFQAALALSELKDKKAIPVLEQFVLSGNKETAKLSLEAIQIFSGEIKKSTEISAEHNVKNYGQAPDHKNDMAIIKENLTVKGNNWTEDKLFSNGLFHIIPHKELAFFLSLDNQWDRKEWLRKFWAKLDPTPTTKENEAEEEFQRRVLFTYDNFGLNTPNDNDDFYTPWDSRGEVYIKFGKPDKIEKINRNWEKWIFYRYRIIFKVAVNRNNADSQGVRLSTISKYIYRRALHKKRIYYIKKHHFFFIYKPFDKFKKIEKFNLYLKRTKRAGNRVFVRFDFSFPSWNLKLKNSDNKTISAAYRYRWVIYGNDYKIIKKVEKSTNLAFKSKKGFYEKVIKKNIFLSIPPGSYLLALRIEDLNSNRIGIFTKKFTIIGGLK